MDISGTSAPYYPSNYTTGQYIPSSYVDISTRSIPVTSGISDAPDLTRPVAVSDEVPLPFAYKKKGFGDRIAKKIYGDEDKILTSKFNSDRYQKKHGMQHHNHTHDTHHTVGGGATELPLESHRHEYHMIDPAINRNDKPHF